MHKTLSNTAARALTITKGRPASPRMAGLARFCESRVMTCARTTLPCFLRLEEGKRRGV